MATAAGSSCLLASPSGCNFLAQDVLLSSDFPNLDNHSLLMHYLSVTKAQALINRLGLMRLCLRKGQCWEHLALEPHTMQRHPGGVGLDSRYLSVCQSGCPLAPRGWGLLSSQLLLSPGEPNGRQGVHVGPWNLTLQLCYSPLRSGYAA